MVSGSLYAHFASKEELLHQIVTAAGEEFLASVEPIAASDLTPVSKLREAMRAHVRVVAASIDHARVFLHEWKALKGERLAEVRALRDRYEALWDGILADGVRAGDLREMDPRFARLLVLSAANWIYNWYDPNGLMEPDQVADGFTDLLLGGLSIEPSMLATTEEGR